MRDHIPLFLSPHDRVAIYLYYKAMKGNCESCVHHTHAHRDFQSHSLHGCADWVTPDSLAPGVGTSVTSRGCTVANRQRHLSPVL